jgi:hypothetical protein
VLGSGGALASREQKRATGADRAPESLFVTKVRYRTLAKIVMCDATHETMTSRGSLFVDTGQISERAKRELEIFEHRSPTEGRGAGQRDDGGSTERIIEVLAGTEHDPIGNSLGQLQRVALVGTGCP